MRGIAQFALKITSVGECKHTDGSTCMEGVTHKHQKLQCFVTDRTSVRFGTAIASCSPVEEQAALAQGSRFAPQSAAAALTTSIPTSFFPELTSLPSIRLLNFRPQCAWRPERA